MKLINALGIAAATLNILGTIDDQDAGHDLIKIGEGTLILAAKIGLDRFTKNVVLENLVDQPIRLNTVKRESK